MKPQSLLPLLIQTVKFGAVGMLNTIIDWLIYFVLLYGIGFFANLPAVAKAISYSVGVLNSFFINKTVRQPRNF